MSSITCPLCNHSFPDGGPRRGWPHHRRCPRCLTEVLSMDGPDDAYPEQYFGSALTKFSGVAGSARRMWHRGRARRLAAMLHGQKRPSVYDIGCGDGEFLLACREHGFEVAGCEPVERPRQQAMQRLACDIDSDLFGIDQNHRYDVITAWQVVEHVADPKTLLAAASHHLAPGGILAISTVNLESLQASVFGSRWLHLDPPRHVWVGRRHAVEALVNRCGLEVIDRVWNHLEFGPVGYVDSLINLVDNRRDRLVHCLKTGFTGVANKCLWLAAAGLTPLGVALSFVESAIGRPATFELYSRPVSSEDQQVHAGQRGERKLP